MKTLAAWLEACAPRKELDACSICSKLPVHCSRFEKRFVRERRLVYRVITITPDGVVIDEDAVIGEQLPVS